ncbi:hypothetical protein VPH35_080693 [Triticum aestivum]|uniref:Uncharacterized protein n=1 Tax=Aegilops tauschii TaxID=37682 RepID=M8CF20_AEGTA
MEFLMQPIGRVKLVLRKRGLVDVSDVRPSCYHLFGKAYGCPAVMEEDWCTASMPHDFCFAHVRLQLMTWRLQMMYFATNHCPVRVDYQLKNTPVSRAFKQAREVALNRIGRWMMSPKQPRKPARCKSCGLRAIGETTAPRQ